MAARRSSRSTPAARPVPRNRLAVPATLRLTPAQRASEVSGIAPRTVPVPPPRAAGLQGGSAVPRAQQVQVSPPAHAIRRQAGLGLPSGTDIVESLAGSLGGAAVTAVIISLMPNPGSKWVGALTSAALGVLLSATSPLGTIPSELGMGAAAASGAWMFFDLSGQIPTAATPVWDPTAGEVTWLPGR